MMQLGLWAGDAVLGKERGYCAIVFLGLVVGAAFASVSASAQVSRQDGWGGGDGRQYEFEVFSLKPHKPGTDLVDRQFTPDSYRATVTLEYLIKLAYTSRPELPFSSLEVVHTPDWVSNDWYDIAVKVAPRDMATWQQASGLYDSEFLHFALRSALKECCKLALHMTPVEIPYWDIVVGKHGAKNLQEAIPGTVKPVPGKTSVAGKGFYIQDNGKRQFVGVSMADLATVLMRLTKDYPVQDKTGLPGRYDFTLPWYDPQQYPANEISNSLDRMPIKSVGLGLEMGKGPGILIDVDHIERPDSD
jgi:uncharacterized protein (TIGR03435 family)